LIYQWAAGRYVRILKEEDRKTRFYMKKLKDLPQSTKAYQLELFNDIFKSSDEFHFPHS
jgi:hypothetical protein